VSLERERLVGGEHLQQERQPRAETRGHGGAQFGKRIACDDLGEGRGLPVPDEPRRRNRMRAHPQLGLGTG
jgi:hypothetical protein